MIAFMAPFIVEFRSLSGNHIDLPTTTLVAKNALIYRQCIFHLLRVHLIVSVPFIAILVDEIMVTRRQELTMHCTYVSYLIMGIDY